MFYNDAMGHLTELSYVVFSGTARALQFAARNVDRKGCAKCTYLTEYLTIFIILKLKFKKKERPGTRYRTNI